jgi:H+/Cl- antiporter ClcA
MNLGRVLILTGLALIAVGGLAIVLNKLNVPFGRLPGDIVYRGRNTTIYIPWVTCLVLSVLGSLLLWFLSRRP